MWKCNNETQGHSSCMLASFYLCGFCPSWISKLIMCIPFDYQLTLNWSLFWTLYMHWSEFWALIVSLETSSIYEKCNCISFSPPFTFTGTYMYVLYIHYFHKICLRIFSSLPSRSHYYLIVCLFGGCLLHIIIYCF